MHGTFDELREAHPGQWLLIRTDDSKSETGILLFADKDHDREGDELLRQPKDLDNEKPHYITYSFTEEDDQQAAIVTPFPIDLW